MASKGDKVWRVFYQTEPPADSSIVTVTAKTLERAVSKAKKQIKAEQFYLTDVELVAALS
jgi:hypothetical protein